MSEKLAWWRALTFTFLVTTIGFGYGFFMCWLVW